MRLPPLLGRSALLAACMLAAGAVSLFLGQDANWDLRNYHYYAAFALLEGRLGHDLAPAQIQTYLNPVADLPFYAAVKVLPGPRAVAFAMAAWAGIAGFVLLRMLALLFPPDAPHRLLCILAAAAIGLTGASGIALVGSTMNEWLCASFTLGGVYLAVRCVLRGAGSPWRECAAAGFLSGCAMGLKLTHAPYALGLVAGLACTSSPERARRTLAAGAGVCAGFLVSYGFWGAILQQRFGSPFFPFFNEFFQSPWFELGNWIDHEFGPRNPLQALLFPLWFAHESDLVSEIAFRDYRLAALMVLGALLGLRELSRRSTAPPVPGAADAWILLAVFTVVSYVLWQAFFAIHRYLLPLEVLSGALIVAASLRLVRAPVARRVAIVVLAVLLVGTTRKPGWERVPFAQRYFEVSAPQLPPHALVILDFNVAASYAIPFFRPDARFVAPASNFLVLGRGNLLSRAIAGTIERHEGPLYFLEERASRPDDAGVLRAFGLEKVSESCRVIASNLDHDALQVCPALRRAGVAVRSRP